MRVSDVPRAAFRHWPASNFFGLDEFTLDVPVVVKLTIDVA
jgi:hypothetical protein